MTISKKYTSLPIEIEASDEINVGNIAEIARWCGGQLFADSKEWDTANDRWIDTPYIVVSTLEGNMRANLSDRIIRGTEGEHYPCAKVVFDRKYRPSVEVATHGPAQNEDDIVDAIIEGDAAGG